MPSKKATDEKAVATISATFDELAELESFDKALQWLSEKNVGVVTSDEIEQLVGDGFLYVSKASLVNIPFVVMRLDTRMSPTYNVPMVTVYALTATDKRVKFVDFGSGFREQIDTYERRSGRTAVGLLCKNGLVGNTYKTRNEADEEITAITYRINFGD